MKKTLIDDNLLVKILYIIHHIWHKKYNIQGDIGTLLGKDCKVEKVMRFLMEIGMFEEI